jgi:hypothetical protein
MSAKRRTLSMILFLIIFGIHSSVLAWDDGITHEDLSENATKDSILDESKGNYLWTIGLNDGLYTRLIWYGNRTIREGYIIDWVREGAMLEDSSGPLNRGYVNGKGRSFNHFHNPLKDWNQAGLDDRMWLLHFTGKSSLLWAQDGAYEQKFYEGDWSWSKTREYFYTALTGRDSSGNLAAPDEARRKEYFARTFMGLGHQMHLLQDTSVPDHVRNDAHPEDALFGRNPFNGNPYFESWARANHALINYFAANPVYPNVPLNVSYNGLAPITQLYDSNRYDGPNASAGINQGLAEYTNANFFSNDTIFAAESYPPGDGHYFPFPKAASTDLQDYIDQGKLPEIVMGRIAPSKM